MAKEILAVPEEHLRDVIRVIRAGLTEYDGVVHPEVVKQLVKWCNDEEEYLRELSEE